jgi:hypothetical protein
MHHPAPGSSSGQSHVSQADADRCCAASERTTPQPSASAVAIATPLLTPLHGVFELPAAVVVATLADLNLAQVTESAVPRHLLLSVFVV